jgi:hypothetical protein
MVSGMTSIISEELPEEWVHLHSLGHLSRKVIRNFDHFGRRDIHNFWQHLLYDRCETVSARPFVRVGELQRCRLIGRLHVASKASDSEAGCNQ